MEFGELMCRDALERAESCGCHFREEFQTADGEARRNDADFAHVAVWEHRGDEKQALLHKEPLSFETAHLAQRSYK
jgi:succinate dehydrogenase / fumarate reductase flavoprotein subunit